MAKADTKPLFSMKQVLGDRSWMERGICHDMDTNFFFKKDETGIMAAKRVCASCVVREECLEYALANRINHGVWGGASEKDRRAIIKAANVAAVALKAADN